MEPWIKELVKLLDRGKVQILFGEHAAKDKNLNIEDIDIIIKTVREGKVEEQKSNKDKKRICFKNYRDKIGQTYFVIVEYYPSILKVVTVIKKKGRY